MQCEAACKSRHAQHHDAKDVTDCKECAPCPLGWYHVRITKSRSGFGSQRDMAACLQTRCIVVSPQFQVFRRPELEVAQARQWLRQIQHVDGFESRQARQAATSDDLIEVRSIVVHQGVFAFSCCGNEGPRHAEAEACQLLRRRCHLQSTKYIKYTPCSH